jgi:ABC-2 type transport system ATP-binding protein
MPAKLSDNPKLTATAATTKINPGTASAKPRIAYWRSLMARRLNGSYSRGNRQKVALIAALASDAELLLLDEPTAGLDPLMEATFRDCVIEEQHDGRTILLSSHVLSEAEALSDRVTIIRHGKTVETGTLADMRHLTRILVEAELRAPAALDGLPGVHELTATGTVVRCRVDHAALDEVVGHLHQAGIRSLTCRPPTLEELFLRHYSPERSAAGSQ